MLEFQDGFFEQEVRNGFYLDVTIKTLWASEMELLNKIAEVCDKYGLKWYAAYGTLLGAIRHEGFVPWDDDMDIWMMRKDYNKLMEVLQDELPKGYRVRGPQTAEGYDQFHTCVNNGSGISIAKDWLETNHNCPFTVGIDIFPLDYLPRNKKDRELQKSLFVLVGRVAQIAKNIGRGDFDAENASMSKKEAINQVKDGLKYLKKNYNFNLDKSWIANEEWGKITSEVWKWGNYVAMMYDESESDYIVEYLDWARNDWKMFPKKWFEETYSATFENFMLPIPCGYHEVLQNIYADYWHFVPKTGCHEYPFYARQLRQLREYVKNVEQRAGDLNLIQLDDIELSEKHDIPDEWIPYTLKQDGTRKIIILMANDLKQYLLHGEKALEKLEDTLKCFKKLSDNVLLWWRPQPVMPKMLAQKDTSLMERYMQILQKYKEEKWGICDETDGVECAVEACDAYYGELNAVVQNVQNYPKPVMISGIYNEDASVENQHRVREYRAFVNYSDSIEVDGYSYFANTNYNGLLRKKSDDSDVEEIMEFEGCDFCQKNIHLKCVSSGNKLCFLPNGNGLVHLYDAGSNKQKMVQLCDADDVVEGSWTAHFLREDYYLLPTSANQGIWKWEPKKDTLERLDWWSVDNTKNRMIHLSIGDEILSCDTVERKGYVTNLIEKNVRKIHIPVKNMDQMFYDGQIIWFTVEGTPEIGSWDLVSGNVEMFGLQVDDEYYSIKGKSYYTGMYGAKKNIYLIPQGEDNILRFNTESKQSECVGTIEKNENIYFSKERKAFFKSDGEHLICRFRNWDQVIAIDTESGECTQYQEKNNILKMERKQINVLLERNALLFENENYRLNDLIAYCEVKNKGKEPIE